MKMPEILLRRSDVCERLGVSSTTLWRFVRDGRFPEPIQLPGSKIQGWTERSVDQWIKKHFLNSQEL
ncbi:helix-turn-helix transcriptional regulator [Gilvimarinus xylanilyticus]|uniref:helix-turn-helix transcriptional regulator n=1 Tax=Gilvimarinus xylanilyticus TaxID=2944139 RepID=UPI003AEF2927